MTSPGKTPVDSLSTEADAMDPFASTTRSSPPAIADPDPPTAPQRLAMTVAESDPPTSFVHRDGCVDLPPGSVVDEIYEIDAKLGAGAMGEVYAARHVKLDKRVAIKVIGPRLSQDAAAIERFAQEARALAQIQHPAIVAVDHVGELADGRAYFVMEYLHGTTLLERLQRGRISLPKALRILDQMARGLEAAHARGITHRDLKPENTFLVRHAGEASTVKLLDFGLSKLQTDADRRAERTQSGVAIGTPMYMSPEQARGSNVDHRTDIYALGCVAYELLLGISPFPHARTAPELYAAHLHEAPPLPRSIWSEIPPQLDLVLFAMLAKDPGHRPTLAQVRSVVAAVRTATPSQRAATEIVGPRPRETSKMKNLAVTAAVLIGGIAIGVMLTTRSSRETPITAPSALVEPVAPIGVPAASVTPTVTNDAAPSASTPHPLQNTTVLPKRLSVSRPASAKTGSATIIAPVLVDAGTEDTTHVVDAPPPVIVPEKTPPRPNKSMDRNQTVNPFPPKHNKVTP
jgi:serine/threonine-protein kinase